MSWQNLLDLLICSSVITGPILILLGIVLVIKNLFR
jgi:hypothetical protein